MSVLRFVLVMHALHEANGTLMGCAAACLVLSVLSGLYLWVAAEANQNKWA